VDDTEHTNPDAFADELADALIGVQRRLKRLLRTRIAPRLRGAEVELLRLVVGRPGIRVSAAAEELSLAGNSVSTLVNQLSRQGFLLRETDPEDRRAARLTPTPAARARLEAWREGRAGLVRDGLSRLDDSDREALRAALPALRRLSGALHEEAQES
jgi:DNA-binding MarR family transcriptional regulator